MRMVNAWFNFIHALCSSEPKQLDTGKAVALSIFSLETFVEAEALRASGGIYLLLYYIILLYILLLYIC